jgi:hypothetical protein
VNGTKVAAVIGLISSVFYEWKTCDNEYITAFGKVFEIHLRGSIFL